MAQRETCRHIMEARGSVLESPVMATHTQLLPSIYWQRSFCRVAFVLALIWSSRRLFSSCNPHWTLLPGFLHILNPSGWLIDDDSLHVSAPCADGARLSRKRDGVDSRQDGTLCGLYLYISAADGYADENLPAATLLSLSSRCETSARPGTPL